MKRQNYHRKYGESQVELYFIMREKGYSEEKIQKLYSIPQASLRRCRHLWKKNHELTWQEVPSGNLVF